MVGNVQLVDRQAYSDLYYKLCYNSLGAIADAVINCLA